MGGRLPKSLYSDTYSRFLKLMKQSRVKSGLTQIDLAKRLGRPQSFVSKCESGERRVDVAEFLAFCKAIQIDPVSIVRQLSARNEIAFSQASSLQSGSGLLNQHSTIDSSAL